LSPRCNSQNYKRFCYDITKKKKNPKEEITEVIQKMFAKEKWEEELRAINFLCSSSKRRRREADDKMYVSGHSFEFSPRWLIIYVWPLFLVLFLFFFFFVIFCLFGGGGIA